MNRIVGFLIFFLIFLTVYFGMHFYVFSRLSGLLGIKKNLMFYLVLVLVAAIFPLASIAERYVDGEVLRVVYAASSAWLGVIFFALSTLLVYEIIHLLIKTPDRITGYVIIGIVIAISVFAVFNSIFPRVKTIEIPMAKLDRNVTIAQISDIHIGTIHTSAYLKKTVGMINKLNPDMVLITGDLVDGSGPLSLNSLLPLKDLKAKAFFTTGNHEMYEGVDKVVALIRPIGLQVLRNEIADYKGIQIVGIDYPNSEFSRNNTVIETMKIDKTKPTVLMYHPPQGLKEANEAGVDLQLSGHTHNGQIFPFNLLVKAFYPMIQGIYKYQNTTLYVTPGTGTWGPPMRLGSRSEITVIRLVPA